MWKECLHLAHKDLKIELRSREMLMTMIVFSLLSVLTFRFAFIIWVPETGATIAPGVLWMTISFAGMFSLWNAFAREKDRSTLNGLGILPVPRSVIYISKVISTLVLLSIVLGATLVFLAVFYNIRWSELLLPLVVVLVLGNLGFVSVGIMISGLATHARGNAFLLPVLVGPIVLFTILQPAVSATSELMSGGGWEATRGELQLLFLLDVIFLISNAMLFEYVMED